MGRQHKQALPGRGSRGLGRTFVGGLKKGVKLAASVASGAAGSIIRSAEDISTARRTARAAATGIAAGAAGRVRSSGNRAVTNPNRDTAAAMRRGAAQAAGRRRK